MHATVEGGSVSLDKREQKGSEAYLQIFFIRQLSRHLVGLWTAENPIAMNLLKRILVRLHICSVQTFKQIFDACPIFMTEAISVMKVLQAKNFRMEANAGS